MNDNNVAKFLLIKFFVVPDPLNRNYVNKLTNIIKKNNINLVLPGSDFEALALSKNRKKFMKQNCYLASIDYKSLLNFSDKLIVLMKY